MYGIRDGMYVWKKINEVFDYFPLACTLHDTYFCVHGGLSEELKDLRQLKKLSLPVSIQEGSGSLENQILWSDPDRSGNVNNFRENPRRGPQFGPNACDDFFKSTGTKKIIRAHQTAQDGYFTACENRVITVFSAPCYKGVCDNDAAVLVIRENHPEWIFQTAKEDGVVKLKQIIEMDN
jgi:diadenosine tetraphosphatase ApaH/serine/threonine PP2A family protein phosphatase